MGTADVEAMDSARSLACNVWLPPGPPATSPCCCCCCCCWPKLPGPVNWSASDGRAASCPAPETESACAAMPPLPFWLVPPPGRAPLPRIKSPAPTAAAAASAAGGTGGSSCGPSGDSANRWPVASVCREVTSKTSTGACLPLTRTASSCVYRACTAVQTEGTGQLVACWATRRATCSTQWAARAGCKRAAGLRARPAPCAWPAAAWWHRSTPRPHAAVRVPSGARCRVESVDRMSMPGSANFCAEYQNAVQAAAARPLHAQPAPQPRSQWRSAYLRLMALPAGRDGGGAVQSGHQASPPAGVQGLAPRPLAHPACSTA